MNKKNTMPAVRSGAEIDAERASLPGDVHDRLREQREIMNWSPDIAAERLGASSSDTYRRYEKDHNKEVPHSVIAQAAAVYHVSTDYLLGLTDVKFPTAGIVEQIGMSEQSVKTLIRLHPYHDTINRIVCWNGFGEMIRTIDLFVHGHFTNGIRQRNAILAGAMDLLNDAGHIFKNKRQEIRQDIDQLDEEINRYPDEFGIYEIQDRARRMAVRIREDVLQGTVPAPLISRSEFREMAQESYERKQRGERITLVDCIKESLTLAALKTHLFEWRSTDVSNEIIVTLPTSAARMVNTVERITQGES